MAINDHVNLDQFMAGLKRHNPNEKEFHQAVREVVESVWPENVMVIPAHCRRPSRGASGFAPA